MTTVYVVTKGEYSDYGVVGIYSIEELAKQTIERNWGDDYFEAIIDEFVDKLQVGLKFYSVVMLRDGTTHNVDEIRPAKGANYFFGHHIFEPRLSVNCWAKNEQHAIKIANEYRTRCLALNIWGDNDAIKELSK